MLYRTLGRTGLRVSVLGFGCMRLPVVDGQHDRIDEAQATAMLHHALEQGVTYVDTAYPYHGLSHGEPGTSELFVGKALEGGSRERVLLATKLPGWMVQERDDMEAILDHQLKRLRTDHIDCYLLHGLNAGTWAKLNDLGVLEFLDRAVADGRIRHPGFSFHDDAGVFAPIVDAYEWDFCQIQYNYMDVEYQAGRAGLRYAAERGLGVVVMEPLKGGRLAARVPPEVRDVFARAGIERTPAAWALRYVWDDPGVSLLLSGMGTMDQVVENLATADEARSGSLTAEELALFDEARTIYRARVRADCTACRYCMPCPSGVDIPGVLQHLNDAYLYDDVAGERTVYSFRVSGKASDCTECGQCEEECPQHIPIRERLAEARGLLEA